MLLIQYLIKLSVSLAIVWLFYQFVLRKLTFYNSNRWYLLGYTLLCFGIPFIDISPVLQKNEWANSTAVSWVPVIVQYGNDEPAAVNSYHFFTPVNCLKLVFISGMFIMLARLVVQLISFQQLVRRAKAIPGENLNLFQVDERIIPFSFGNFIFINQHLHTAGELHEIIRHEFVHVKQKHSIDIIWGELLCIVNWYNPFAWLLRRSIRQNLEFIADNKVLENGLDKKQYQYLLLKVIGNNQFSIAPKFNFSSLKKRIAMMNKLKTAKLHLVRFLFILPLLAVILLSFRRQMNDSTPQSKATQDAVVITGDFTDTVPDVTDLNDKGYYIDVKGKGGQCVVLVKDKNRKEVERVLLTKWNANQKYYDNLYGEIVPPPPTPPSPPTPPGPPTPPLPPSPVELPEYVKKINVSNNKAKVTLKDGKVETYDLTKPSEKASFENKYGEILPKSGHAAHPANEWELAATGEATYAVIADRFEITDDHKAHMRLKDGSVENYDLNNKVERQQFETKYGKVVEAGTATTAARAPGKAVTVFDSKNGIAPVRVEGEAKVGFITDDLQLIPAQEEILVTITKKTTREQLDGFIKQMKEKGITLQFDNIVYDNGTLISISGVMKYKNGQNQFSVTDFKKLTLSRIKDGDQLYLKVDTHENKTVS